MFVWYIALLLSNSVAYKSSAINHIFLPQLTHNADMTVSIINQHSDQKLFKKNIKIKKSDI